MPAFACREEVVDGVGDRVVLARREDLGHRLAVRVVAAAEPGVGDPVPDRRLERGRGHRGAVGEEEPGEVHVGRAGDEVDAVRPRARVQRGEVPVERRVLPGERAEDGERRLGVVADRPEVGRVLLARVLHLGEEEAVALAAVQLRPPRLPLVLGVHVRTALVVVVQVPGRVERPGEIGVAQAGLAPVGAREPAQEVVEGPVLHHQDDDVLERRVLPRPELRGAWPRGGRGS